MSVKLTFVGMLCGCTAQPAKKIDTAVPVMETGLQMITPSNKALKNYAYPPEKDMEYLLMCQKKLGALQKVDQKRYSQYRSSYDLLVTSTTTWSSVRSQAGDDTTDAIDALYEYKRRRLCSGIHQALLQRLGDTVERLK